MGRKVNYNRQTQIGVVFTQSKNRQEFVEKMQPLGFTKNTCTNYWYSLCKKNGVVVNEKRGRRPNPLGAGVSVLTDRSNKLNTVVQFVEQELVKAQASKKSTATLKAILDLAK